jgi:inhibitor of the pro-sigma K processing machinery
LSGWGWAGAVLALPAVLLLLRKPLRRLGLLLLRSGGGLAFLWLFRGIGGLLGLQLGVNLLNAVTLGVLGVPGLALLLFIRWAGF